jgi:hypothetical protein
MGIPTGSSPLRVRFNYPDEKTFCARCGQECQPLGHMMARFLMCPTHGEFTIAPVVIEDSTGWWISFADDTEKSTWETCRYVDEHHLSGRATRTG